MNICCIQNMKENDSCLVSYRKATEYTILSKRNNNVLRIWVDGKRFIGDLYDIFIV